MLGLTWQKFHFKNSLHSRLKELCLQTCNSHEPSEMVLPYLYFKTSSYTCTLPLQRQRVLKFAETRWDERGMQETCLLCQRARGHSKGHNHLVGVACLDPTLLEASDKLNVRNSRHMNSEDLFLKAPQSCNPS